LRAWLHGIVSHAALDAVRRRRVRVLAAPAVSVMQASGTAGDFATGLADRDLVESVLADLKPDVRAALVLRHYYGYDYADIAGFLKTSPGNVGSILTRGHAALRTRLAAETAGGERPLPERAVR
jgi:RNA polymerase sigma-70 factor (ECF subfamily)